MRGHRYSEFRFVVDLGGSDEPQAGFSECSITETASGVEYRDGRGGGPARAPAATDAVILRRGLMDGAALHAWLEQIRAGDEAAARTVAIRARDEAGEVVTAWTLRGARIVRQVSTMGDATGRDVGVEEIELRYESLTGPWLTARSRRRRATPRGPRARRHRR